MARLQIGQRVEAETSELVRAQVLLVGVASNLGGELETMLVVLAEPRQHVRELRGRRALTDVHRWVAAKRDVLHARRSIGERRIHAHGPTGQREEWIAVEPRAIEADRRLAQHAEAEVAGVAALNTAVPVRALAAVRGQFGRHRGGGILAAPRS